MAEPGFKSRSVWLQHVCSQTVPSLPPLCLPLLSFHPGALVQPEHIQGTLLIPFLQSQVPRCHIAGAFYPTPAGDQASPYLHTFGMRFIPHSLGSTYREGLMLKVGTLAKNKDGTRCMKLESKEVPRGEAGGPRIHLMSLGIIHPIQNHPSGLSHT